MSFRRFNLATNQFEEMTEADLKRQAERLQAEADLWRVADEERVFEQARKRVADTLSDFQRAGVLVSIEPGGFVTFRDKNGANLGHLPYEES